MARSRPKAPPPPTPAAAPAGLPTWNGDLPALLEKRAVRMLVVYSKTFYFIDKGQQRGITYDFGMELEKHLNASNKDKTRPIRVVFIPVARDQLLPALAAGAGDIATGGLTVTPERMKLVDFTAPAAENVSEIAGDRAGGDAPTTVEELSGRSVYVRRSSSYYESLAALNTRLAAAGKKPVDIVLAEENLEDEDILEMVNAGLVDATVVDSYAAEFWKQIFTNIRPQPAVALRTNGAGCLGDSQGQPRAEENSRHLRGEESQRHDDGQCHPQSLPEEHPLGAQRHRQGRHAPLQRAHRLLQEVRHAVRLRLAAAGRAGLPGIAARSDHAQSGGRDRRHAGDAHHGARQERRHSRHPSHRAQHPCGREVPALSRQRILRRAGHRRREPPPVRIRVLQRRARIASRGCARRPPRRVWTRTSGSTTSRSLVAEDVGRETVQYVSNIYKYYIAYKLTLERAQKREGAKAPATAAAT